MDFERLVGPFDKARYKAAKLREHLRDVLITLESARQRLPARAYLVLKWVGMGVLHEAHVVHVDIRSVLRLQRHAQRLSAEIADIRAYRQQREAAELQRALIRLEQR